MVQGICAALALQPRAAWVGNASALTARSSVCGSNYSILVNAIGAPARGGLYNYVAAARCGVSLIATGPDTCDLEFFSAGKFVLELLQLDRCIYMVCVCVCVCVCECVCGVCVYTYIHTYKCVCVYIHTYI